MGSNKHLEQNQNYPHLWYGYEHQISRIHLYFSRFHQSISLNIDNAPLLYILTGINWGSVNKTIGGSKLN